MARLIRFICWMHKAPTGPFQDPLHLGPGSGHCGVFPIHSLSFCFPHFFVFSNFLYIFLFLTFPFIQTSNEVLFSGADRCRLCCCCFYWVWYSFYRCTLNFIAIVMRSHLWFGMGWSRALWWRFIFNKFKSLYMWVLCALIMRTSGMRFSSSPFFMDKEQKFQKQFIPHSLPDTIWT